jgi:hypothetical protein
MAGAVLVGQPAPQHVDVQPIRRLGRPGRMFQQGVDIAEVGADRMWGETTLGCQVPPERLKRGIEPLRQGGPPRLPGARPLLPRLPAARLLLPRPRLPEAWPLLPVARPLLPR